VRSSRIPFPDAAALALVPVVLVVAVAAPFYADGPPAGRTGGFGEPSCHECHTSEPLNATGGSLRLDSLPAAGYEPGRLYRLQVQLARAGMASAGFELSVRRDEPGGKDKQAGLLDAADDRSQLAAGAAPVQYLEHTRKGTGLVKADTARWLVLWKAPDQGRPVVFHIAANAANDDNSALGDFIYTTAVRVGPRR
jgi:hypothetical protein